MAMKHPVSDTDVPFSINTSTRKIINNAKDKTTLMQGDHNSERFTFLIPRTIEEHDMYECDVIEIHYENTSVGTSTSARKTYRGKETIKERSIASAEEEVFSFSWLVPETATMFAGSLKFQIKFICYDNESIGVTGYKWHTDVNSDMTITPGLPSSSGDINPTTIVNLQSIEIVEIEGGVDIILDGVHHKIYNGSGIGGVLPDNVELTDNKVTSITENATDTQYPSAKAVLTLVNSIAGGSVPSASSGISGYILQTDGSKYVLKPVSSSSVATYISGLKTTTITKDSTNDQLPSAKAVYDLLSSYSENANAAIIKALNTDVEV